MQELVMHLGMALGLFLFCRFVAMFERNLVKRSELHTLTTIGTGATVGLSLAVAFAKAFL